jgi:ubiquinone/menaquinone biosynthesis C-methylase UbiE
MVKLPGDQKSLWARRGGAYDRWADAQAAFAESFNIPLLDAARVRPGAVVLDVAAGAGEPALSLARRVGARGHVVASDLSAAMLAGAVRRVTAQQQTNVSFAVADMVRLPFGDAAFDAITCRFGLMFVPDVVAALNEARRVLRADGRAAFLVWGPVADNTLSAAIMAALDEVVGPEAGDLERLPFRLAEPGLLAGLMREAGFERAEEIAIKSRRSVPADGPFWTATVEKCLGEDWRRDQARGDALDAAIGKYLAPARRGGTYDLANHVRIGVGVA